MENNLTLFDKVWESHVVKRVSGGPDILLSLIHISEPRDVEESRMPSSA